MSENRNGLTNKVNEYIFENELDDFFDHLLIEYEGQLVDMYLMDRLNNREIENMFIQYYEAVNDHSSKFQEFMVMFVLTDVVRWEEISKHIQLRVSDYFQI